MGGRAKYDLTNKTSRAKLAPRPKPYFTSLQPRLTLGWVRQSKTETGRWVRREEIGRDDAGSPIHKTRQIGLADDLAPADGHLTLSFQQAARLAADPNAGGDGALTLASAIDIYAQHMRTRSKYADSDRKRLVDTMSEALLRTPVVKLSKEAVEGWFSSLVRPSSNADPDAERRSKDSANRTLTILRAALNYVTTSRPDEITDDRAWRLVKRFRAVARPRTVHFATDDVLRWIDAAEQLNPALAVLMEGAFHTGARFGELRMCDVRHFDPKQAHLHIPFGKTGPRNVLLPAEANAFFKRVTARRKPNEPLFPMQNGERWEEVRYRRPLRYALRNAGLNPEAVFYTLRHSNASRRIEHGQPLLLIAEELGTSVKMLEENYGKFLQEQRRRLIEETAPRLRPRDE